MRRSSIMLIASALAIGIGSMTWAQTPVEGPSTKPAATSASDPPVTPVTPSTPSPALQAEEAKTTSGDSSTTPASTLTLLRVTIDPELAKSNSGEIAINRLKEADFARLVQVEVAEKTSVATDKSRTIKMYATLRVGQPIFLPQLLVVLEKAARANILDGIRIEPKTDLDEQNAQNPTGTVTAAPETPYAALAKALTILREAGVTPLSFAPGAGEKPSETAPFATSLLILEDDWFKSPTAKEAEADLEKVMADFGLSKSAGDPPLLSKGPRALFVPETILFYQPDHCAALIAWLQRHKLLKETIEFPAPTLTVRTDRSNNQQGFKTSIVSRWYYCDDAGRIPLFLDSDNQQPQPFAQSRLVTEWFVDGHAESNTAEVLWSVKRLTQFRGQPEPSKVPVLTPSSSLRFQLSENRVALLHGLALGEGSYNVSGKRPEPVEGLFPLLMVRRTGAALPAQPPAVSVPDAVLPTNLDRSRGGPERAAMTRRGTSRASEIKSTAPPELHVISLKQASAAAIGGQLQQLMRGQVQIASEPASNSVLVSGTHAQVEEIRKILAQLEVLAEKKQTEARLVELDRKKSAASNNGQGTREGSNSVATASATAIDERTALIQFLDTGEKGSSIDVRKQFETTDRKAKELARNLKDSIEDRPVQENEKLELRKAVADAFAIRQKLQRLELAELSTRLRDMAKNIEMRDAVKDRIIDRRVDDLLNRDLGWDTDSNSPSPNTQKAVSEGLSTQKPEGVSFTGQVSIPGIKVPDANSQYDHPEEKSSNVKSDRSPDKALHGVWGIDFARIKVDESTVPPENQIRLVFWGDRHAVFRGGKRTQLMSFKIEKRKSANWIVLTSINDGQVTQGMYEVIGDGLRLSLSSDPKFIPDRFGTAHPEFIRISKDVPKEFLRWMQDSEEPGPTPQSQSQAASNFSKDRSGRSDSAATNKDGLVIRSAEEFQRLIDEATDEQENAEQVWKDAIGKSGESDSEKLHKEFPVQWAELNRAKRRFKIIHDELAAQLQLLRLDVQTAESKLRTAMMERERTDALFKQKAVSTSEVELLNSKVDLSKLATMRAQTLLDLYTKINQEPKIETPPVPATGRQ